MSLARHLALAACSLFGLSVSAFEARAQDKYPSRPVRMVVPLPPGGAIDVFARSLGQQFEARTGASFVVENRAGANTIIAANACKSATPDGYTVCLLTRSTISINPAVYRKLSYDPLTDFEPITNAFFGQQIVILHKSVPADSFAELVAYTKQYPDKLNYASVGVGGDTHLLMEWLKITSGARLTHVPFKGLADAMIAFTANNVQMFGLLVGNPDLARQIREKEIKGLLLPGSKRSAVVPDVPTFAEVGLPAHETMFLPWFGFFAPKGTLKDVVDKLNLEFTTIIKSAEFSQKHLHANAFTPAANSAADFARFIVEDRKTATELVAVSGVRINE